MQADDLPPDRLPRHHPAAGDARRDRGPARPPGHPHPARRRGRRQRRSTSCSTCCSSIPARPGHRRLRARLRAGPGRQRRRVRRRRGRAPPDATAPRCAPTSPASGRAARAGVAPRGPHPHPARRRSWSRRTPSRWRPTTGRDQEVDLATHQLALTLWTFLAFSLDAIAIAAQALTGRSPGCRRRRRDPGDHPRMVRWGLVSGSSPDSCSPRSARSSACSSPSDPAVRDLLAPVLLVAALGQPIAGVVFVLDGVLIGAGDGRYLAWARPGHPGRLRPGRAAAAARLRRPGRRSGWRSRRSSWAPAWSSLPVGPAATPGW